MTDVPTKSHAQSEDDILALDLLHTKNTLEQIWKDGGQILLNDYRSGRAEMDSNYERTFTDGVLFPSHGSRKLHFRFDVRRPIQDRSGMIAYDARSTNFVNGSMLTGVTSGATGYLAYHTGDGLATGTVYLRGVNGSFLDGETLSDSGGGSATANGAIETITGQTVDLKAAIWRGDVGYPVWLATVLNEVAFEVSGKNEGQIFTLEGSLSIPSDYWNDHSTLAADSSPIRFAMISRCQIDGVTINDNYLSKGDAIDYAELIHAVFFEEI